MKVRSFIRENLRWKLGAFLLALLAWIILNSALNEGDHNTGFSLRVTAEFVLPIAVHTEPQDPGSYALEPSQIRVSVRGSQDVLRELSDSDFQAFVDLVPPPSTYPLAAEVLVRAPTGVQVTDQEPHSVLVAIEPLSRQPSKSPPPRPNQP